MSIMICPRVTASRRPASTIPASVICQLLFRIMV